ADLEIIGAIERVEKLLAHAHECGGAAGREVKASQQLLPARLGRAMDLRRRVVARLGAPRRDGSVELVMVGAEAMSERLEERNARTRGQLRIALQDLARERHARRLAAAGEQLIAKLHQARRALLRALATLAGAIDERAPALRDAL